ncbi:MAG: MFS transporter [Candidatus Kapaibacteriales bacterium]
MTQDKNDLYSPKAEPSSMHFVVIAMITLASVLSITSIGPALPLIKDYYQIRLEDVGILMSIYTVPGIFLTPLYGFLADRFSRKAVIIPTLLIYATFGVACAFAPSFGWLVFFRLIQGIGSAPLGALNISLLGDIYSGDKLARNTGLNAMVLSIGTAVFPLLGGGLAQQDWSYPFLLAIFGYLVIVLYLGFFKNEWKKTSTVKLGEMLSALFRFDKNDTEYRQSKEFRKISLFNLLTFFLILGAMFTYLPQYLKNNFSLEPIQVGLFLSIMSFAAAFSSFFFKKLLPKIGHLNFIRIQFATFTLVFLAMPYLGFFGIGVFLAVFGLSYGINTPNMQFWVLKLSGDRKRAIYTSLHRSVTQLGLSLGPAIIGYFITTLSGSDDQQNGNENIIYAYQIGAGISAVSLILSLILLKKNELN